ncbi:glycerol-3-phosphate acyltransferase mino isoform X2 [Rhodnius prolixus]|uniref:glycerol-3-phosphate acyltransferase mino isoform X2 n=1 Tax=Rhodnius prolixus TaxID=13249 RepID=UPI003D189376
MFLDQNGTRALYQVTDVTNIACIVQVCTVWLNPSNVSVCFLPTLQYGVRAIIETMSVKVYDAFSTMTDPTAPIIQSSRSLHHHLTQYQLKRREQLTKSRTEAKKQIDEVLYQTKQKPYLSLYNCERRPISWLACEKCSSESRKNVPDKDTFPVIDVLKTGISKKARGYFESWFSTVRHCLTFKGFHYPYIYESVLQDENVKEAIYQTAQDVAEEYGISDEQGFNAILEKQRKRAAQILTLMHAKLSNFVLRISSWVFYKTLPILFKSISIPEAQVDMLKEASKRGLPMIFLPLHRSHIDYIAVTFTLCNNNIRAPIVAAGENLRIPVFGRILRGLGAFFIKRRIDPISGKKDKLYRAILHNYMTLCLEAGHYFEFFIEGGRTRTGKPCMPKGGLLSVFVDAYLSGILDDALLVPVSVNYEKIVEGSFVRELTGAPKQPETFRSAIAGIWKALTSHYGIVRVDFNQPFSLLELVKSFQSKTRHMNETLHIVPSSASLYGTDIVVEEQRQLVDSIARHIIYDCSRSTAVMSTNALAFLLLNIHRDGVSLSDLTLSFDKLRNQLSATNKDTGFSGDSVDVIEHAVDILGPGLVQREKQPDGSLFLKPVTIVPNVIELAYYSNTLLPHFALDGVLGRVIMALSKRHKYNLRIRSDEIIDTCFELCGILQYEFLFTKACQSLIDAFYDVLDSFVINEILVKHDPPRDTRSAGRNLDFVHDEDEDDEEIISSPLYSINDKEKLKYYAVLFDSLIDTYSVTFNHLFTLIGHQITEGELVKEILQKVTSLINLGVIRCGESLSTEAIRNSIKLLEKMNVLLCHNHDGTKIYYLNQPCENELTLEPIAEKITKFQDIYQDS